MSLQTGTPSPDGPASQRLGDQMKFKVALWRTSPNPIWIREMRQSARLLRTPIILMTLTVLMALLMTSIGAVATGSSSPADVGLGLFHTYFSLAYFVVTLVGPALAANSIASEREGRTWEALLLTGMRPAEVARGKFMAAYTAIGMYIVMLAPVGAIPFLFGGVTPIEVLVAFAFLFLIALLSVAFGLAISSKMPSLRAALVVTLLVAVMLSGFFFFTFGFGFSFVAHELWPGVERGMPVWVPAAYSRAPFDLRYLIYLVAIPASALCLPAWLLYEITRANLTSVTDDRSVGLKRWFFVASAVCAAVGLVPIFAVEPDDRSEATVASLVCYGCVIVFCAFLFGGEAIGPSRRVKKLLEKASAFRRLLTPGIARIGRIQVVVGLLGLCVIAGVGLMHVRVDGTATAARKTDEIVLFALYTMGYATFLVGLVSFLRARQTSTTVPRVLLAVGIFATLVGPWILAAMSGALSASSSKYDLAFAVASPSPFYVFIALDALRRSDPGVAINASVAASLGYFAAGAVLLALTQRRCSQIERDHEALLGEADRRLAEEDAAAEAAAAAPAERPAEETAPQEQAAPDGGSRDAGGDPA
ncbi:MAG: ABC transporter permease [Myxococcales bacterium]|nr:ABC transporter permease [Myxococcales bacterium]